MAAAGPSAGAGTAEAKAVLPKGPVSTPSKTWSLAELKALITWMRETWPAAFGEPLRPLALGSGAAIGKARPEGRSHRDIGAALRFYVNSDAYLEAVRDGVRRIHLDGSDGGEVTEEHRLHARKQLEQRQAGRPGQQAQQVSTEDRHG
jgi:ProP effector